MEVWEQLGRLETGLGIGDGGSRGGGTGAVRELGTQGQTQGQKDRASKVRGKGIVGELGTWGTEDRARAGLVMEEQR